MAENAVLARHRWTIECARDRWDRWAEIGESADYEECIVDLAAEAERLQAECEALRADAALGALVRRMPERSGLWRHRDRDGAQQWSEVGLDMDDDMCWATIETSPEAALGEGDDA